MKVLSVWTIFEKILLLGSILLVSFIGVVFKSDIITVSSSIMGIITALLLAKGKSAGQLFGIILVILYSIVSFKSRYYGEVIIYILLMLPMYVIGVISWLKHQDKETDSVSVNTISLKEWLVLIVVGIFVFGGVYFLLKYFNTNELLFSSISVITSLFAVYLGVRRSKYSFSFYILNDFVLMGLWGIPVIKGAIVLLPMLFNPIINLINDIYGVYNWHKMEEIQNK